VMEEGKNSTSDFESVSAEFPPLMTFINGICTLVSVGIAGADIVAVYVLLKCRRIPTFARIFSINFILSDAVGSLSFFICQLLIFAFGMNTELMHNIRTVTVGFMLNIAMMSVSCLAFDRAMALRASLRYAAFVTKTKGIIVVLCLWSINLIIVPPTMVHGIKTYCPSMRTCDQWNATKLTRLFMLSIIITSQISVTLSYFYVLKIARAHHRKIEAMKRMAYIENTNTRGVVSERQFSTTTTLLKLVLAFIVTHTPIVLHLVVFETNIDARNDLSRRIFHAISFMCLQANSIISLKIYVARFKECQMMLLVFAEMFCKNYTQRITDLRMDVYNIVVSTDHGRSAAQNTSVPNNATDTSCCQNSKE